MKIPLHRRNWSPSGGGRILAVAVTGAMTAALALVAGPASAAGNGVLDVVVTPVNLSNGATITDASDGTNNNQITYKVQYSCTTAECDGTQVQFSPAPADPHGLLPDGEWILEYDTWVAPAAGGTISGNDTTGKVVDLGDLAAGTSGTFSVTYGYQASRNREVPNGSFYPDGFKIPMSATVSSSTAASKAAHASDVTWHIGVPNGPSTGLGPNNGTFKTDTPVTYSLAVNPGNMVSNPGSNVAGGAGLVATGNYKIVYTVPSQAVIQSATDDGVIDNVHHTVTWTKGSAANPSYGARGGWGLAALSGFNSGGAASNNSLVPAGDAATWGPRKVTVEFPGNNFPEADASGCNFTKQVTSTLDVTVNYLDSARTEKTTERTMNNQVACTTPFGGVSTNKLVSNGASSQYSQGDGNMGSDVFALNVPAPGETDTANREWRVQASNQGNVAGTAVIDEPNLDQDHIKVWRILAYPYAGAPDDWQATVHWKDNTGATGTAQLGQGEFVDAEPGRWFVSAKTTAPIAAGRILPTDNTQTSMQMGYRFHVDEGAIPEIGQQRTNDADVSISYPADADGDGTPDAYVDLQGDPLSSRTVTGDPSRTVQYTQPLGTLTPGFVGSPVVDGGGNPKPGTGVTFSMRALTSNVWPGTSIRPQLVFLAPVGWKVVPDTASFTADGTGNTETAPAGVTFDYATRTVDGEQRSVVVATWPSTVALSSSTNDYWPTLSVTATPTTAAPVGVNAIAAVWAGDQSGEWSVASRNAYMTESHQFRVSASATDGGDVDGDANTTEDYAARDSGNGLVVAASDALAVIKEACVSDITATDGCSWVSDPSAVPSIQADPDGIKYRVRLINAGNTTLHDVVAYDVLPHTGDTGLLANPSPRGSQFGETLRSVESVSQGVTVDASSSTNPARPEVNPGASGTTDDWGAATAGKKALRMTVDGALGAGEEKDVVFVTEPGSGAKTDQIACNSVAVDSAATLPAEPPAVCVSLAAPPNVPPTASITTPEDGAVYFVGQKVPASYSCADVDDNLVSCEGPVANGADVDTSTVGTHQFKVTATDAYDATGSDSVSYRVVPVAGLCRGTGLSLLGIRLGNANGRTTPCAADHDRELNLNVWITPAIPLLGVAGNVIHAGVISGDTQSGAGSAAAQAGVATLKISILGQTIEATGLTSSASSTLSSCGSPATLAGLSSIASLKINNKTLVNLDQPITVPLLIGSLGLNQRVVSGNTITESALHLNVAGLVDLALGQSVAGATC